MTRSKKYKPARIKKSGQHETRVTMTQKEIIIGVPDPSSKEGRLEFIRLLMEMHGTLRTKDLIKFYKQAGIPRSRRTLSNDLRLLVKEGRIKEKGKGIYYVEYRSFDSYEIDQFSDFFKTCQYYKRQDLPHPFETVHIFADQIPQGLSYNFKDIGEKVLARSIQNIMFSSYLMLAGDRHIPLAPSQLKGEVLIPDAQTESIWEEKGLKGKLLVTFCIDLEGLHNLLKLEEGKPLLSQALKETLPKYRTITEGVEKALNMILDDGCPATETIAKELRAGPTEKCANEIEFYLLPFVERVEIDDKSHYRLRPEYCNMLQGWRQLSKGEDPERVYRNML